MGESLIKVDDLIKIESLKREYFNHKIELSKLFRRLVVVDRDRYFKNKRANYNLRKDCINYVGGLYPIVEVHLPNFDLVQVIGIARFEEGSEGSISVIFMYPLTSDEAFEPCTLDDVTENYNEFFNRFVFEDLPDFYAYLEENNSAYGEECCNKIYTALEEKIVSRNYDVEEVKVVVCNCDTTSELNSNIVNTVTDSTTEQ